MDNIKDFNSFLNENSNWDDHVIKRRLVNDVIPNLSDMIKPIKDFGKRVSAKMRESVFGGMYLREKQKKHGFNPDIINDVHNNINSLDSYIGPNLAGEFKMVKATIWNKISGTKSLRVVKGESIVDNLIRLIPEIEEELNDREKEIQLNNLVNSIWAIHPNNPKNRIDDIVESKRSEMYDEEEYKWNDEIRKDYVVNDKYFLYKAKKYKQMMINLSKKVLNYKSIVIENLEPYKDKIDKKSYNNLISAIDRLYNSINGDSSKIKGVKTRLQYSIVELLDKYINKDNSNYKVFF